jgi:branched-chain amino acid transport system permease protein
VAALLAIAIAVACGALFGAIASGSEGIYLLMLTLALGVITFYFFEQVPAFGGHEGINAVRTPAFIGDPVRHPDAIYYLILVCSVAAYAFIRGLTRTAFGLALQGVRDDPVRMSSLGYNVGLHRTLAFGFAGFVAAVGGVLFVWWNGHIDPASIDLGSTIDVLVIAVIGGLYRLEGAWVGALFFIVLQNYVQRIGFWSLSTRFESLIGVIFLLIILVSPGGLVGLWERLVALTFGRRRGPTDRDRNPIDVGRVEPSV